MSCTPNRPHYVKTNAKMKREWEYAMTETWLLRTEVDKTNKNMQVGGEKIGINYTCWTMAPLSPTLRLCCLKETKKTTAYSFISAAPLCWTQSTSAKNNFTAWWMTNNLNVPQLLLPHSTTSSCIYSCALRSHSHSYSLCTHNIL